MNTHVELPKNRMSHTLMVVLYYRLVKGVGPFFRVRVVVNETFGSRRVQEEEVEGLIC